MITSKACGKLYWAGEYAVVNPNNTAIIKNVNRYLTVSLKKSGTKGVINTGLSDIPINWQYIDNNVHFDREKEKEYIYDTLIVMTDYIKTLGITPICFDIDIQSELKSKDNIKYGLGSSAAIVVALVKSISKLYDLKLTKLQIFKLSCIVSIMMNSNSSMGDIAVASFDSLIAYTSFDREVIRQKMKTDCTYDIVNSDWQYLNIEVLQNRLTMSCLVGWTKVSASSSDLVNKINNIKHSLEYNKFVSDSKIVINHVKNAILSNDMVMFKEAIEQNRILLANLGKLAGVDIETKELHTLSQIAKKYGECSKLSGAGGGDCGIAFVFDENNVEKIIKDWEQSDIKNLGKIFGE